MYSADISALGYSQVSTNEQDVTSHTSAFSKIQANIVTAQIITARIGYNTVVLWTPKFHTFF